MNALLRPWAAVLAAGLLNVSLCAAADEEPEASAAVKEARQLLNEDKLADALKVLESRLKASSDDREARVLLARVHSHEGEAEKAAGVLEAGLRGNKDDAELLWYLGQTRMQLGEDGPNVKRTRGTVSYGPSKIGEAEEEAWKQKQWGLAAEAWRKFIRLDPDNKKGAREAAKALAGWKGKTHLAELAELQKKFGGDVAVGLNYAGALTAAGRAEEALATAEQITKAQPRSAEAWKMQAGVLKAMKREPAAAEAQTRADFYESLPACAGLEYAPETAARLKAMADEPAAESKKLIADKSEHSSRLMAVLCWQHLAHGPVEDSCFVELTARKMGDLLCELAEEGQSICTYRGCCRGLAALKHPRSFEIISRFLEDDTNPVFHIEAAGALAALGDARAVALLVKTLAPAFRESERQRPEQEADFMGRGPLTNRLRCALALGSFTTLEAKAALTKGAGNPELAACCEAALYRHTKDAKHLKAVATAVEKAGHEAGILRLLLVEFFEATGTAEARQAAALMRKAGEKEEDKPGK